MVSLDPFHLLLIGFGSFVMFYLMLKAVSQGAMAMAAEEITVRRAHEKKKREEERLAVLRAVNNLQLQSVMSGGARSSCMINTALYTEGQQVEEFTVEKVSPNSVIVRHGTYRFELKMQR